MPLSTTASLTGTIFFSNGKPAAGKSVIIKKTQDTSGNLISTDHTLYKTNLSGQFFATVPKNSYVWIYSDVDGFNSKNGGSVLYIGNSASYKLETLTADINYPEQIPVAGGGGGVSTFVELSDVPNSYVGYGQRYLAVKNDETGLEYVNGVTTSSLSAYATTASLSVYATTASLSAYATTASLNAYSATSHTHSNYVQTTGNETISGSKTFSESPKTSASPSNNNDLTNKLYVDTQIGLVNSYVLIDNQQTNDSTPISTQLSGFGTDTVYYYDVLAVGRYDVDSSAVYLQRTDYVINNAGGTIYMLGIYPQHLTTNGITGAVGHSLYKDGDHIVSSITGDATNEMTWYIYANIKGV